MRPRPGPPGRRLPAAGSAAALVAIAVLSGCGGEGAPGSPDAEAPLLVLAASDLQHALPQIAREFERATGRRVTIVLGSTGNLAAQIEQGAPGDLFLAANERFVDRVEAAGRAHAGTRRVYAIGRIAVAWREGMDPVTRLEELADPRIGVVGIANPEHAPYGQAAREALVSAGLWDSVEPKLVLGENVAQAFQFVSSGNADAGVTALGVLLGLPGTPYLLVDASLHAPLRQAGVVLGEAADPEAAADLLAFLAEGHGQAILRAYGFEAPED